MAQEAVGSWPTGPRKAGERDTYHQDFYKTTITSMSAMGTLTNAQHLMEEELQQSLLESEGNSGNDPNEDAPGEEDLDAEGEEYDEDINNYGEEVQMGGVDDVEDDEEPEAESSAESEADGGSDEDETDQDAEVDDEDNYDDADGEIEETGVVALVENKTSFEGSEGEEEGDEREDGVDDDEDDDEEGVGAVKLRPGETDDEEESEASEGESFHAESDANSEGEAEWEDAVENEDEADDDEDDESGTAPATVCMFCKQDEDNDPSEQFETFLTCISCGESGRFTPDNEQTYGFFRLTKNVQHTSNVPRTIPRTITG